MWKYVPTLATALIALAQLAKDWGAHQATWRRALVLSLIFALGLGSTVNTYYSNKSSNAQHVEDQKQITKLQQSVEGANTAQKDNTKLFLQSFKDLSQRLGDLQSQVKTADLQKEADRLRKDLAATQKALVTPKAELEASLGQVSDKLDNLDVKEIQAERQPDGTLSFTVTLVNKSSVQAKKLYIILRICNLCEYAEEPQRFMKIVGAEASDREMDGDALPAQTAITIPLKIKVPGPPFNRTGVSVSSHCENCEVRPWDNLRVRY